MSLRPRAAAPTARGECDREQKARLECALRAGLVEQERRNGSAPTGVVGPLLSGVITRQNEPPSAPRPPRGPDFPTGPRDAPPPPGARGGGERAYARAIDRGYLKDAPITVEFGGSVMNGTYTGETINGVPDGNGDFVVTLMSEPLVNDRYGELQSRAQALKRDAGVDEETLRAARAAVEAEAAIPTEAYDAVWKDIKSFARTQKKDQAVTINLLVKWAKNNRHQLDLFGAHSDIDLNNLRDRYLEPLIRTGDELGGAGFDAELTTSEFKSYVAALRRGEVDITPDRRREHTAVEAMEIGQQVLTGDFAGGEFVGGLDTTVSTVGGTEHTLTVARSTPGLAIDKVTYEMRQGGTLTQRIVLGRADETNPALHRGKVLIGTRNRVHRFGWSGPAEQVKMRDGTARVHDGISDLSADRVVLNGMGEVRVTVAETGEQIWLKGELVDDRLRGKVTASAPVPGVDGRVFYVDGYDEYDVPIVRVPTKPSPPPTPTPTPTP
ncbi:MAG: hypothetical protein ACKVI4_15230, partial [Actinomycetales bacterium]